MLEVKGENMNLIKINVLFKYFTPLTFFVLAIILSFKMSFQGRYLHDFFLKSIIDNSIKVHSESSNLTIKGITLSNSEITLDQTSIGTIGKIRITPKITQLISGQISAIKATSGTFLIDKTTLPIILNSQGIDLPLNKLTLDNIAIDCFGIPLTLKSQKNEWQITNAKNEQISITALDHQLKIRSPLFTLPYVTLANLSGSFSPDTGLELLGNISPLRSHFNISLKKEGQLIALSGTVKSNNVEIGHIIGAYNTDKNAYTLKAKLKEIPFKLFSSIFKHNFDLPIVFQESGLVGLNFDKAQGMTEELKSFNLNLTNLKASFFLYDLFGINGTLSLDSKAGENPLNISVDSIRRHKLNFENTVILMKKDQEYDVFPSVVTTEFSKGHMRLHDFKMTKNGLEATAEIEDLDINDAITKSTITSIAATGTLKGTARLLLTKEKVIILNAQLSASSPKGKIHYFPKLEELNDQKSSQAMENLDYTILNLDLETKDINEPADLKIQIVGTNPAFSNGYPLDFTIETKATLMDFYS